MKIDKIQAVNVDLPPVKSETPPRRQSWREYASVGLPMNKYPDYPPDLPRKTPGIGGRPVWVKVTAEAETSAALAKAVRMKALTKEEAISALQVFRGEWTALVRVQATEVLLARADELAWELGLRGYDAVHLASALLWQQGMGEEVTVATFDQQLWEAAEQCGMVPFPDGLPAILAAWSK